MNSVILANIPVPFSDAPLLARLLRSRVCAGFPSPAEDLGAQRIDLTQMLVVHPQATYFLRASGQSMVEAGIFDNDIMVVDRAIKPRHNPIVVAIVDGASPSSTCTNAPAASNSKQPIRPSPTSCPRKAKRSRSGVL